MLNCWTIEDWSGFFCLLQNCESACYNKLLFHWRYVNLSIHMNSIHILTPFKIQFNIIFPIYAQVSHQYKLIITEFFIELYL